MGNVNAFLQTFAGGEFGDAMQSRVGIESYQAACETMENFFPLAQGPMFRRPPLEFIGEFEDSDKKGVLKKFEFDISQNYLLCLTDGRIDFYLNDGKLEIPETVCAISNGTFDNFTDWTNSSDTGSSAAASGGHLVLTSDGAAFSRARTTASTSSGDTLHVMVFDVLWGPVDLRIGSYAGAGDYGEFTKLRAGHHRISFTPSGTDFHIEFAHKGDCTRSIDNVSILNGPDFYMPSPWVEEDLRSIFTAQDGDRLFMFSRGYPQRVLERRGHRSWSLILYEPNDGPFVYGDDSIKLTPSGTHGNVTITSSSNLFTENDERKLLRLTHRKRNVQKVIRGDTVFTDPIKVTGVGGDRSFTMSISGTFVGTVTLERSISNENNYAKVLEFTAADTNLYNDSYADSATETTGTHDDALYNASGKTTSTGRMDNVTCYYRFAVKPGDYTSGVITVNLSYEGGSQRGVARITSYISPTSVSAEVIKEFGEAGATELWDEGEWSAGNEYPNVVAFSGGRLWMARRRELWGSVSDDYFSIDMGTDADRALKLTLRSKSAEGVRWMRHLDFLCIGTQSEEYLIRSTSAAEPIGPATAEPALQGEEGGAAIEPVIGGDSIVYIHRALRRAMQFAHNTKALSTDSFISMDLNRLNPDACIDGIVNLTIQQEPERRLFAVLSSGICKTTLYRKEEEIVAWTTMKTQGYFEDCISFTENDSDALYFIVRRSINGTWKRFIERFASEAVLNDEDMVHLDCMLQSDISRPDSIITPDNIEIGESVTVDAVDACFSAGDVGKILWCDGGRILVGAYVNAKQITGTIVWPLDGEKDDETGVYAPRSVVSGRWGLAVSSASVTGLDHLIGETVHVWADKTYFGTAVVSPSGGITLPQAASRIFVGLCMPSRWKGLCLAYGSAKGTAIAQKKSVFNLGLVLDKTADGLMIGQDFERMKVIGLQESSPLLGAGPPLFTGIVIEKFDGSFSNDPRITIRVSTPGPTTIKGLIPNIQTNER